MAGQQAAPVPVRVDPVGAAAGDRSVRELEGHEPARVEGDEPVAGGDLTPGEPAHELVLGADPHRPGGQTTNLVQAVLPPWRVGHVGDEREHLVRWAGDRQARLLSDHDLAPRGGASDGGVSACSRVVEGAQSWRTMRVNVAGASRGRR